jgi:hypothetical protein
MENPMQKNIVSKYFQVMKELFGQRFGCYLFVFGTFLFCISSFCIIGNLFYLDNLGEDIKSTVYINAGLPICCLLFPLFGGIILLVIGSIVSFIKEIRNKNR